MYYQMIGTFKINVKLMWLKLAIPFAIVRDFLANALLKNLQLNGKKSESNIPKFLLFDDDSYMLKHVLSLWGGRVKVLSLRA